MNENEEFITMVSILNNKLKVLQSSNNTLTAWHDQKCDEVESLVDKLDSLYDELALLRSKSGALEEELRVYKTPFPPHISVLDSECLDKAREYMVKIGNDLLKKDNKLACIQGIRAVTGWYLKDSKDYVESYMPKPIPNDMSMKRG